MGNYCHDLSHVFGLRFFLLKDDGYEALEELDAASGLFDMLDELYEEPTVYEVCDDAGVCWNEAAIIDGCTVSAMKKKITVLWVFLLTRSFSRK